MIQRFSLVILSTLLLGACASTPQSEEKPAFVCAPAPTPVRDIRANSYYTVPGGSIVDQKLFEQYKKNIDPIQNFARDTLKMADGYVASGDPAQAKCVVNWLSTWAKQGALLGEIYNERGFQANYVQKWTLGSLAMAAFKVRDQLSKDDHQLLDPWLKTQAQLALDFWNNPDHERNNHLYWTGMAMAATAAVTNDESWWEKSRMIYDEGLSHIAPNGALEREMKRGQSAMHYHNYSLMPLSVMAELARVRGEDWYARQNSKLLILADLMVEGWIDQAWFAVQAGKAQKPPTVEANLGWVVWFADKPLRNKEKLMELAKKGPFYGTTMGGNPELTTKSIMPPKPWYWPF
jgi:poly(beta-D-mannuronate) lyase